METTELNKLCERKVKAAQAEHALAVRMMTLLTKLQSACTMNADEYKTFRSSLYKPYERREAQASQQLLFWMDQSRVAEWLEQKGALE